MPATIKTPPYCPLIKGEDYFGQCKAAITKFHFAQICNTSTYERCLYYGKIKNQLLKPMEWLQKAAVEEEERRAL